MAFSGGHDYTPIPPIIPPKKGLGTAVTIIIIVGAIALLAIVGGVIMKVVKQKKLKENLSRYDQLESSN